MFFTLFVYTAMHTTIHQHPWSTHIIYLWYFNRSIIAVPSLIPNPNLNHELFFLLFLFFFSFCCPINFHLPHRKLILFVGYRVTLQMYARSNYLHKNVYAHPIPLLLWTFHKKKKPTTTKRKKHPYARTFGPIQRWFETFNKSTAADCWLIYPVYIYIYILYLYIYRFV